MIKRTLYYYASGRPAHLFINILYHKINAYNMLYRLFILYYYILMPTNYIYFLNISGLRLILIINTHKLYNIFKRVQGWEVRYYIAYLFYIQYEIKMHCQKGVFVLYCFFFNMNPITCNGTYT